MPLQTLFAVHVVHLRSFSRTGKGALKQTISFIIPPISFIFHRKNENLEKNRVLFSPAPTRYSKKGIEK
ncbi:MAG: hypothetical protein IJJ60_05545, partial [Clostridia bacterium]|nr:hypothetical protein [Clostridia bacterium]